MANMIKTDSTPVPVESPEPASAAVKELLVAMRDSNLNLDHIVELIAGEPRLSAEIRQQGPRHGHLCGGRPHRHA